MRLLIDGYNLLHATDLFGSGELAGTLRGSREALVAFLAERLTERERRATVVVFDAADAPPNLPDRYQSHGLDLRFARGYPDADAMIEEILEQARAPRQLLVVSGDRRVQRAARSRGARPVDSAQWFGDLRVRVAPGPARDREKAAAVEAAGHDWVAEFSDPSTLRRIEQEALAAPPPVCPPPNPATSASPAESAPAPEPADRRPKRRKRRGGEFPSGGKNTGDFGAGVFGNPFPPGYGEDLLGPSDRDG